LVLVDAMGDFIVESIAGTDDPDECVGIQKVENTTCGDLDLWISMNEQCRVLGEYTWD